MDSEQSTDESNSTSEASDETPEVDERYYTVSEREYSDVAEHCAIDENCHLKLAIGPCRVGTKAQLFTVAASGYPAYDQPLKAIYRCLGRGMEPEAVTFGEGVVYFKETIGPYTLNESRFDPLEIVRVIRNDTWLRENLKVVLMLRDPVDTWQSWLDQWADKLERRRLLENFFESFRTLDKIGGTLDEFELPYHVFDYSENRTPGKAYRKLFSFLELSAEPVCDGWKKKSVRETIRRNWRSFREPDVFLPDGIREEVKNSDGVFHRSYPEGDPVQAEAIRSEVGPIYDRWSPG